MFDKLAPLGCALEYHAGGHLHSCTMRIKLIPPAAAAVNGLGRMQHDRTGEFPSRLSVLFFPSSSCRPAARLPSYSSSGHLVRQRKLSLGPESFFGRALLLRCFCASSREMRLFRGCDQKLRVLGFVGGKRGLISCLGENVGF